MLRLRCGNGRGPSPSQAVTYTSLIRGRARAAQPLQAAAEGYSCCPLVGLVGPPRYDSYYSY